MTQELVRASLNTICLNYTNLKLYLDGSSIHNALLIRAY